jgi:23S rRNA pseudouridine1911/1915/1917 synthase
MRYTARAPGTLGDCLGRLLAGASGRTRKQMLAGGRVRVNGVTARRADTPLSAGDVVEIGAGAPRATLPPGLRLVHEDGDVLVVDKPPGLLTIATERERQRTVYAHLMARARAR